MEREYLIYCDMDGVLTDYSSRIREVGYNGPSPGYGTSGEYDLKKRILLSGEHFWSGMKWIVGGKRLWKYIENHNPVILSSVGKSTTNKLGQDGVRGKQFWLQREIGNEVARDAIIVPANKHKWARLNTILIDDNIKYIKAFRMYGGIGVLHKSTDTTIMKLKQLGL